MLSASFILRLRLYPDTLIEIGSPRGATCSTLILSPGTQPISISFKNKSLFSNDRIFATDPAFNSDNLFIIKQATNVALLSITPLRFLEMSEKQSSKVQFHFLSPVPNLRNRTALKAFLLSTLKKKHRHVSAVNYIFCSDDYLLNINKQFLNHHYFTDIITFDLSEAEGLVAEIYISVDRVKDNAASYNTSFINELHRVIFHGALHLCGLKDKSPKESAEMRAAEQKILNRYFK